MVRRNVETWKRFGELLGGEVGEGVVDSVRGIGGTRERNAPVGRDVDDAGRFALGGVGEAALEVETDLEKGGVMIRRVLGPRECRCPSSRRCIGRFRGVGWE